MYGKTNSEEEQVFGVATMVGRWISDFRNEVCEVLKGTEVDISD